MFQRLQFYTVHTRPDARPERDYPLFVREGFNFFAFLFTVFWAVYHRLWMPAAAMFAFNILIGALGNQQIINEGSAFILLLAMQIVVGFHANDWLRAGLRRRGYVTAGIVSADSRARAELRFFERYAT